jgi:hypothetical protein
VVTEKNCNRSEKKRVKIIPSWIQRITRRQGGGSADVLINTLRKPTDAANKVSQRMQLGIIKKGLTHEISPFCYGLKILYYSFIIPVKFSDVTLIAAPSLFMMHSIIPKNLGNSAPIKN